MLNVFIAQSQGLARVETAAGAFPARTLAISLEGRPPGRYELTLEARDDVSGMTRDVQEPYVVEGEEVAP